MALQALSTSPSFKGDVHQAVAGQWKPRMPQASRGGNISSTVEGLLNKDSDY